MFVDPKTFDCKFAANSFCDINLFLAKLLDEGVHRYELGDMVGLPKNGTPEEFHH